MEYEERVEHVQRISGCSRESRRSIFARFAPKHLIANPAHLCTPDDYPADLRAQGGLIVRNVEII